MVIRIGCATKGHEDRPVRGYRKNEDGSETYLCSECFEKESSKEAQVTVMKQRHQDFLMFKRLLFQVRDGAINEAYLYFLAGYFGLIPTPDDLNIPEKGYFKLKEG